MSVNNAIAGQNAELRHDEDVVHKAEQAMAVMGARAGLSSAGEAWCTLSADIMHDTSVDCSGLPDYRTHRGIVQTITRTQRYTKPPLVPALWSCNIFTLPVNQTTALYPMSMNGQLCTISASPYLGESGTVTVSTGPPGQTLFPPDVSAAVKLDGLSPTTFPVGGNTPTDNYTNGNHRVIAAGFEVYMTASDLYNGGDVLVWKQPASTIERSIVANFPGIGPVALEGLYFRGPPATAQQAMTIPGSRRWRAKDGCYVPMLLNEEDIPFRPSLPMVFAITSDTIPADPTLPATGVTPINGWPNGPQPGPDGLSANWFHSCGAFFDGIDPNASLTVVARFVVEREPSVSESDLIVLARPSPPADEIAWRIYSEMVRTAPAGCPVNDNALGAWFANLVGDLATEALPMATEFITKKANTRKSKRKAKGQYGRIGR